MAVGSFYWFDLAKKKIADGTILLGSHSFKAALTTTSQALAASFTGSSGGARYADLTAELATANGYTAGGQTLSSVVFSIAAGVVSFTAAALSWSVTGGGFTFRYLVIYDDSATNKDLLCVVELNVGGSTALAAADSPFVVTPAGAGLVGWS